MAEVRIGDPVDNPTDVDMTQDSAPADDAAGNTAGDTSDLQEVAPPAEDAPPELSFVDYLKSPITTLQIGTPSSPTLTLNAHTALLLRSPYFSSRLSPDQSTTLTLEQTDPEALGCFLEYLYTGEYTPKKLPATNSLEPTANFPSMDESGDQLLRHAKVYTLAEEFSLPALKSLSHSKIHLVSSSAVAELAYARYVYRHTPREDTTIRKPVASFWGQRSHVLRHETEGGFRELCLEFPEFAFDVLSFVLDVEERRSRREEAGGSGEATGGKGRKRARVSAV